MAGGSKLTYRHGLLQLSTKSLLGAGLVALASLISVEAAPAWAQSGAATAPATAARSVPEATAKPAPKPAPKKPVSAAARARARRARLAQSRAAATAREMADAALPRYKVDGSGALVPDFRAAAGIIYDAETGEVLWEENGDLQRSIASITKVMTAIVFLECNTDLTEQVLVTRADVYRASTTLLRAGDRFTTGDLLHLLLIASDNAAARVLARVSPLGSTGFIERMNEKAAELGLESTHYVETSGLLAGNMSSARDMARLITLASEDERISSIMRMPEYTIANAKRKVTFRSTNYLVREGDYDVRAGKTGFISKAGYCLATVLRLPQTGRNIAVVVFGARSNAGRFLESRNLVNWVTAKASSLFASSQTTAQNDD
jgi:D-alanyl-D-alanine endopeptidase (penicillin-binding protein 7)